MKKYLVFLVLVLVLGLSGCTNVVAPSPDDLVDGVLVSDTQGYFSYNMLYNIDFILDLDRIIEEAEFTELESRGTMPVSVNADITYIGNNDLAYIKGYRQVNYPEEQERVALMNWYQRDESGTTVYTNTDNTWEKLHTDEVFDWFLDFNSEKLAGVVLQDVSMSDTRYVVSAKADWYYLNSVLNLDSSIDALGDYGVDLDNVVFDLKFEYSVETYRLMSLEIKLASDVDMSGRSLIFDGFVLNIYPDYSSDELVMELPDELNNLEEEYKLEEEVVDNTIRINMMAPNPEGYSGEDFMIKVREYFSLSDIDCRTFTNYDTASSSFKTDDYSLKLGIKVFRGSEKTAADEMVDVNEDFYMSYISEYFGGEVVNKSEDGLIYVYSVSKFNPVEIHMLSGNAIISITGSTNENVSPDEMFDKISGFMKLLERNE